jgi:hypothetical protein
MTLNSQFNRTYRTFLRYAQSNPGGLTIALLGGTTFAGIALLKLLDDDTRYMRDPKEKMSFEEARLIAMLENAKESSWQQNLENAVDAHEKFMLPNSKPDVPDFMNKIDQRSKQILEDQHKKIEMKKMRKETTKFWS